MPKVKIYIHAVWSTKERFPFLSTLELRKIMWDHIKCNAKKKDIYLDVVNGYAEHCHCLISLGVAQTVENVIKLIKGESSFWFNRGNFRPEKFEWQSEYYAAAVSESQIEAVRNYILNQEQHHHRKTFDLEYAELIRRFGLEELG